MSFIRITDAAGNGANMFYLYNQIAPIVSRLGGLAEIDCQDKRCQLNISIDKAYSGYIRGEVEDKISDVVAVNYKYEYFKKKIHPKGINGLKYEFLLDALICADLDEDKRYVRAKMSRCDEYSIDGTFNFRMTPLKNKWEEIVGFIPDYFAEDQLREFIIYILKEKQGKKVYIENERVYDKNFNRLQRCLLTNLDIDEARVIREVILSGSGEVELNDKPSEIDEYYLKEYFGDKIRFGKGFFVKNR